MGRHHFPKIFTEGPLFNFDHFFLIQRKKINSPLLNKLFQFIAAFEKHYFFMSLIYASIFYFLENKYDILQFLVLVTLSDQMSKRIVKDRVKRRRPAKYLIQTEGKIHIFSGFKGYTKKAISSMCSSHAANFLAQALLVNKLVPVLAPFILPFYVLIGIARWFIGAHWVTDILVGWTIGISAYFIHVTYLYPFLEHLFLK